jgi:uncharacterized protein YkwD
MRKEHLMKHTLSLRLGLGLVAVTALAGMSLAAGPAAPYPHRPWHPSRGIQILWAVNAERQKAGLPALQWNSPLATAAYAHAANMARQNNLSHTLDGKGPADRISAAGYNYSSWAENIAWNYASAQDTVTGWMNSPGHRANILNPNLTEAAAGFAYNAQGQPYDCMDFGRPR